LTASLARISHRIGYNTDGRGLLLTEAIEVPAWRAQRHEVFYYLNIIAEVERRFTGRDFHATRTPDAALQVSHARQHAARDMLDARFGVEPNPASPLVVICPGSTNSRAKRWQPESFAALADRLIEESQATVLLIGANIERDVSDAVAALMLRRPVILTGETTLAETIAVMSLAAIVVSNDTGPAHIAGALGRPTLVVFGPTNPVTTRPFSETAEVIREPPLCAPCMLRECPIDHRCMTRITPDAVFASASRLLLTSNRNAGVAG
jgi:heptosyltransferase-2